MRWLLSLLVYWVGMLAALAKFSGSITVFSTGTNIAFLIPLFGLCLIPTDGIEIFMPAVYILCVIEAFGSFVHHLHACANNNYRVLDHFGYLLLYSFLMMQSTWSVACRHRLWRFLTRLGVFAIVSVVITCYNQIMQNVLPYIISVGCVSGVIIFLDAIIFKKRQAILYGACTILLVIALFVVGGLYNHANHPQSEERDRYDMMHGIWHLLAAQGQFILIWTLITDGKLDDERPEMLVTAIVIVVLLSVYFANVYTKMAYFILFLCVCLFWCIRVWQRSKLIMIHVGQETRLRFSWKCRRIHRAECA